MATDEGQADRAGWRIERPRQGPAVDAKAEAGQPGSSSSVSHMARPPKRVPRGKSVILGGLDWTFKTRLESS